ncbi:MAG: hypothetical protein QNJ72_18800 [Pleurocapsa sp. MO_226.B13]|nr:hypothetical protein [Pleurocapsa sp. MO_226.B13]
MKNIKWNKIIGLGLCVFALSVTSATLTGCEAGEQEIEQEEELEEEE